MAEDIGKVAAVEVEDNPKTARVTLNPDPGSSPGPFRLTDDNDTAFNAMLSACVAARILNTSVTLTHDSGNSEVDKVKF